MEDSIIEAEKKYLVLLKDKILDMAAPYSCEVFLFGSRARGKISRTADYDIGIKGLSQKDLDSLKNNLEEWWEDSIIPHKIDLVNWDAVDRNFKETAEKDIIIWKSF